MFGFAFRIYLDDALYSLAGSRFPPSWVPNGHEMNVKSIGPDPHSRQREQKVMGDGIATGVNVKVTGVSSTEHGAEGVVKVIRRGWAGKEAVVVAPGVLRSREFTVPVADLSRA